MTSVVVRQSGGANIISLPKVIVKTMSLEVGSKLDLSIENNKIVLTPIKEETKLADLLAGSPEECFRVTEDDRAWIDAKPVGKEM